jgi:hypothetical protein
MTLAEAGEIFAYWADNPPAHLMIQTIAAMLGWKPRAATSHVNALADVAMSSFPGMAVAHRGDLTMPAPILDIGVLRAANGVRAAAAGAAAVKLTE